VAEGISSPNLRGKRTILNRIQTLQGKPNTHAWNIHKLFQSNRLPFIPDCGQATTSDLQDRTHTTCAGHTSVARLQNPYSCLPRRTYSHRSVREKNQINRVVGGMPTCRADWLLGLPLTIFCGMWLVLSNV
jgi:hypothetical protein